MKLNLECAIAPEMVEIASRVRPDQVTIVPERRAEVTTEGGLDVVSHRGAVADAITRLRDAGIAVSLFLDPAAPQIETAASLGAGIVELHTGCYANADGAERQEFINCLTTNLTAFFREDHHFQLLMRDLPALQQARRKNGGLRIWCSASSTGEEPYSIAMTLCDAYGSLTPPVKIIATDIDTEVLSTAAVGVYPADRVAALGKDQLRRFFLRGKGTQEGQVRVRDELRALIEFRPLNLLAADWALSAPFDAIF